MGCREVLLASLRCTFARSGTHQPSRRRRRYDDESRHALYMPRTADVERNVNFSAARLRWPGASSLRPLPSARRFLREVRFESAAFRESTKGGAHRSRRCESREAVERRHRVSLGLWRVDDPLPPRRGLLSGARARADELLGARRCPPQVKRRNHPRRVLGAVRAGVRVLI